MPLLAHVFRHPLGDCTNGGVSSKGDSLIALGPLEQPPPCFKPREPLVRIVPHFAGLIRAVPVNDDGSPVKAWCMMGGNFLHTSDSRFREMCDEALALSFEGQAVGKNGQLIPAPKPNYAPTFYGAVAIHDRIEA